MKMGAWETAEGKEKEREDKMVRKRRNEIILRLANDFTPLLS